jgi:hypothetical protein
MPHIQRAGASLITLILPSWLQACITIPGQSKADQTEGIELQAVGQPRQCGVQLGHDLHPKRARSELS